MIDIIIGSLCVGTVAYIVWRAYQDRQSKAIDVEYEELCRAIRT